MSDNPTVPTASSIVTIHSQKKLERETAAANIDAQTGSSIFDDILAQICDQIVEILLEKANTEDETPSFSLEAGFILRKMYNRALEHLGLSDEYSALSDLNIYKQMSTDNEEHSLNSKFKTFLSGTHNISFTWMSDSETDYSDKTGYYKVYDSDLSTLNTNRETFELFLVDSIASKFTEKGYVVSNTIALVRNGIGATTAEYGGLLTISIS